MSETNDTATSAYEPAARDLIGDLTHEFARAWKAGLLPTIDDFLGRANGCDRDELTRRLVSLEVAFRRKKGDEVSRSDYRSRYPCLAGSEHETIVYPNGKAQQQSSNGDARENSDSRHQAAENLLFGMLGWQMHFIQRDDLVHATQVWTSDKSRTLAEVLIAEKRLSEEDAALIWVLVRKHVEQHGGSLHRSLASISSDPDMRRELSGIGDVDVSGSLEDQELDEPSANDTTLSWRSTKRVSNSNLRYVPLRPFAHGGLGEIFVAYDSEVGREVALKEIQRRHAHDETSRTRFVLEGEITGGLEHPGIVSVYGLGVYPDGRPYYAMQLIKGVSLKQAVEKFHKQYYEHPDDWTFELRRLLERFKDVCETIEYAHSRGVLHRDLKPSNIMLGRYGETLVIDWGLAKPLGHRDPGLSGDEHTLRPSSGHGTPDTMIGSAIGTPAYMSPEQARGRLDEISFASDIFSLGATLYTILTDKAPYSGKLSEKLEQARTGDFPPPRALTPIVPRALEAICLKAMALSPEMRYENCHDLALDIERWLAGEPVSAYREPVWTRGARWVRRHRTQVIGTTTVAILLVSMLATWQWREHRRLRQLAGDVTTVMAKAERSARSNNLAAAQLQLTSALARLEGESGLIALRQDAEARLQDVETRQDRIAAQQAATDRLTHFHLLRDEALFHGTLLPGFDVADHVESTISKTKTALALFGVEVPSEHGPKYDQEFYSPDQQQQIDLDCYELLLIHATALARRGADMAPDGRRSAVEHAIQVIKGTTAWAPATRARHLRLRHCLLLAERFAEADAQFELAKQHEPASAVDHFLVGDSLLQDGKFSTALESFLAALRVDPHHFWAQYFAAVCLLELDRPAEAIAHLTAAESLRDLQDAFVWIPILRGYAYGRLDNYEQAEREFDVALKADPREYGVFVNRGAMRIEAGNLDLAVADLRTAIELKPRQYQAYLNLGEAYRRQEQYAEAIVCLSQAIELAPDTPKPYRTRALVRLEQRDLEAALRDFEAALKREPAESMARAEILVEQGKLLSRLEQAEEALAAFEAAIACDEHHAEAHHLRAEKLLELERGAEALPSLTEYVRLTMYVRHGAPSADVFEKRGFERSSQGEYNGAIADYTAAIELEPDSALARGQRGWAWIKESSRMALVDFDEAIRLEPENGDHYCGRGYARVKLGAYREAVEDAEAALRFGMPEKKPRAQFALRYNAAAIYAQALIYLNVDPAAAEREQAIDRYQVRAIELLRDALQQLPMENRATTGRNFLQTDEDFAHIRSLPAFQMLLVELTPKP